LNIDAGIGYLEAVANIWDLP